ncbi:protein C-mannosyl-transferase DPY19L1 isoform X2 [Choristoneura fumiferana]|uniref:protein C-mannosyl-transferase DPY19L1 isoform X2 n=1 Tax=Choristoneura fumiferana TaxID=7141 RepID=UPI003D15F092
MSLRGIITQVIIGAVYRYLEPYLNTSAFLECHTVYRGDGVEPVRSCVGLGQPIMFYLEAIWGLAGVLVTIIFLSAYSLSDSVLGGALAVVQYFANHAECTRVQWAPNQRENLAAPLLAAQLWLVAAQLRGRAAARLQVSIFILNCLCLLFWQFSQFIFLTQTAIFFVMEQLKIIDIKALCVFLHSHFCGLHMAVLLLQGNDMLKTSLYTSFFLVVSAYCLVFSGFRIKIRSKLDLFVEAWLVVLRICIVVTASLYLKHLISDFLEVHDDSHIWDILYSKFSNFRNFHTMLYTCTDVFDFLPLSSIQNMTKTCLIPIVVFNIFNCCYTWVTRAIRETQCPVKNEKIVDEIQDESDSGIENNTEKTENKVKRRKDLDVIDKEVRENFEEATKDKLLLFLMNLKIEPEVFYNIAQLVVFGIMAALIMRLKLLFGTQLCIVSSLFMNTRNYVLPKSVMKFLPVCWFVFMASLAYQLNENISAEMSHIGEFSDFPQEELLDWITRETAPGAAFAGSVPLLATVMLVTRRPIIVHPHYENKEARERTYAVYKMYGKFSTDELYRELTALKAMFLIVEPQHCYGRSNRGCSFEDIWDIEAPQHRDAPRACHRLLTEPVDHFYPVFRNKHYAVFRIHDYSVRYMPRSFDT